MVYNEGNTFSTQIIIYRSACTLIIFLLQDNLMMVTGVTEACFWRLNMFFNQSFIYSPTDVLVSCLKNNIKIGIKFTLKQLRHVSVLQF